MILSIETSTEVCSVALHAEGKLLAYSELFIEKSHATALTILIKNIFVNSRTEMKNLTGVALSKGPGSYTGLRVGTSVAKGLCYALDIPLYAVDTLEAMAHGATQMLLDRKVLLCPMIDARRMEVYTALLDTDLKSRLALQALVFDQSAEALITSKLTAHENFVVLFGSGAKKCKQASKSNQIVLLEHIYPSAKSIGDLFYLQNPASVEVAYFEPAYLKPFYTQATVHS